MPLNDEPCSFGEYHHLSKMNKSKNNNIKLVNEITENDEEMVTSKTFYGLEI